MFGCLSSGVNLHEFIRTIRDQKQLFICVFQPIEEIPQLLVMLNVIGDILRDYFVHNRMRTPHGALDIPEKNLRMIINMIFFEIIRHITEQRHFRHREQIGELHHLGVGTL